MRRDVPTDQPVVGSLYEAAIGVHEMFSCYVQAGFTRDEALKLTMAQLRLAHECPNHSPED